MPPLQNLSHISRRSLNIPYFDDILPLGIENDDGIFSGSCRGDSGGPLTVNLTDSNSVDRATLTGIVSGGACCGCNIPGWYTKVKTIINWCQLEHPIFQRFLHTYPGLTAS